MRTPLLLAAVICATAGGARAQPADMVMHTELRVCADPNNMPWTNKALEGFENRIATVIGADLQVPVTYFWFPMVSSFVRNTLGARQCDLAMGEVGGGPVDDTNPYYRTGYQIVTRAEDGITARSVTDPALAGKRFGIIAATPPTDLLLKHGLLGVTQSYSRATETHFDTPARQMIQDLLDKKIDAALLWGPIAGYTIAHEHLPLHAAFLPSEPDSPRLDYRIAMSVRAGEPDWRRRINTAIVRHQDEITAILQQFGVPLLDGQNRPIPPAQ
jgi:quinoprotein dehydrogenase-associated probable ABC transporter substrate-binding protein